MKNGFIRKHYTLKLFALRFALVVSAALVASIIVTLTFPGGPEEAVNVYPYSTTMLLGGLVVLVVLMEALILPTRAKK